MDFANILKQTTNFLSKIIPINISSVISFDDVTNTVSLYYKENEGKGKPVCAVESFRHAVTDEDFSSALSKLVKLHFEKKAFQKTAVILPDSLFFTDTIKLPVIQKKAMNASLGFAFNTIYTNYKELKYLSYPLSKDKKNAVYNVVGIRKEILEKVTSALTSIGVDVAGVTFASNAAVDRAISFNPKIKNADCILVDVKEKYTRFSLIVDGKAVGYYSLPFGYSKFSQTETYREETLFDHSSAELLVLNAKEKAKNKKLTTYDSTPDAVAMENFFKNIIGEGENAEKVDEDGLAEENSNGEDYLSPIDDKQEEEETVAVATTSQGKLNTKTLKRLPKYMVRPTPDSAEGFIYENFRPIVKWALELARSNQEVFVTGAPKTIFVNVPDKYSSVFDSIKGEMEGENEIAFLPLSTAGADKEQRENLELYGGLYVTKRNKFNVF